MTGPLQSFEHKESAYERLERPWVCGRLAEGQPCPIGPDGQGQCQAHHVCAPTKKGDRYQCVRPSAWGGRCEPGPLADGSCPMQQPPCSPVRSLLARRKRLTILTTALAFGILMLLFGGSLLTGTAGNKQPTLAGQLLSPGDLTSAHSSFRHDCKTCHTAGQSGLAEWTRSAFSGHTGAHESRQCLKCHDDFEEHYALHPHNLSPSALNSITKRIQDPHGSKTGPRTLELAQLVADVPVTNEGLLACSTCHHEHRGLEADLTHMTNLQCQSCHTNSFHSFADGHPELTDYPAPVQSRSYFDHNSHYGRHFSEFARTMPDGVKPESCNACHQMDKTSASSVLRPFAESCGSCHAGQIRNDVLPGIAFLNLPILDLHSENGTRLHKKIGKWPDEGRLIGPDAALSPFMMLLLGTDAGIAEAYEAVQDNKIKLRDLNCATPEQLLAVERLVLAIRQFWGDLAEGGEEALREQLVNALGDQVSASELQDLMAGWPQQVISDSRRRWLTDSTQPDKEPRDADQPTQKPPTMGWYADNSDFSIRYRPSGHADPFLRAWLEISVRVQTRMAADRAHVSRQTPADDRSRAMKQAWLTLSDPFQIGRCMKCHTVDPARIKWKPSPAAIQGPRFVKFSHRPHLTLKLSCESCHAFQRRPQDKPTGTESISALTQVAPSASGHPLGVLGSGLQSMQHGKCATCHTRQSVGDSCLKCHNYHIGRVRNSALSRP